MKKLLLIIVVAFAFTACESPPSTNATPATGAISSIWTCQWCKRVAYIDNKINKGRSPGLTGCSEIGLDVGVPGMHKWERQGTSGPRKFKCDKCNLRLGLTRMPFVLKENCFAGRNQQHHKWIETSK